MHGVHPQYPPNPLILSKRKQSVSPPVRAAAGADWEVSFFVEAAAVIFEREVVPDIRELLVLDIAADHIKTGGDVAVGEDIGIQPGACGGAAVYEGIGVVVIEAGFSVRGVRGGKYRAFCGGFVAG